MGRFRYEVSGVARNGQEFTYYYVTYVAYNAFDAFGLISETDYIKLKIKTLSIHEGRKLWLECHGPS